jgi:hypothetical protein
LWTETGKFPEWLTWLEADHMSKLPPAPRRIVPKLTLPPLPTLQQPLPTLRADQQPEAAPKSKTEALQGRDRTARHRRSNPS